MAVRCEAVLFDLDGTLIDTWHLYFEAYTRALVPHFGRRPTVPELIALGPSAERRVMRRAYGESGEAAAMDDFLRHYAALHETLFEGVYPGVPAMLEALRVAGVRLGLVTGKCRGAWEITAARCTLGAFDVVVTDDDVTHPKPHPEGVQRAATALDVTPGGAMYVGDSKLDLEAAVAAEMPFAAALWPKNTTERQGLPEALQARGATLVVETPDAVTDYVLGRRPVAAHGA